MHAFASTSFQTRQHFFLDADSDVLCRIVGLYAARGIRIARLDYLPHTSGMNRLTVTAEAAEEVLRILVAKASSIVGVMRAEAGAASDFDATALAMY